MKKKKKFFYYKGLNSSTKSFYYTGLASLIIIVIFFTSPKLVSFKNYISIQSNEVKNNSKIDLEKVLKGHKFRNEQTDKLNNLQIYDDIAILKSENTSQTTVRLNASTIYQLFEETNYNLKDVRINKLVKPIQLNLLPPEMKMIENVKKRKNLFIQIILPLILQENNQIKLDRKKLFFILNKSNNSDEEKKWLKKKFLQYGVNSKDLLTLKIRMDEVPISLAIAQSAKETGWGTSRFALEGNALFGQWTYSGEGIKPLAIDSDKNHKIMKFKILRASVKAYFRNLNTHSSYREFRKLRAKSRDNGEKLNSLILADYLDKYAATGKEYTRIIKKIIEQNSLMDFDDVKLLPTSKKLKNLI